MAAQIKAPLSAWTQYAQRDETRREHAVTVDGVQILAPVKLDKVIEHGVQIHKTIRAYQRRVPGKLSVGDVIRVTL